MPIFRRRKAAGRRYPRRKIMRRKYASGALGRIRRMVPTNTIKIVRKGVTAHIYNNPAGTDFATNSSWLTIGPKTSVGGVFSNYYQVPFSATFRVSDMYNWAELQPIAEKFKLNYVKIYAYCTSSTTSLNGLGQLPTILWDDKGVDEDTVPTLPQFKEQMGLKRALLGQGKVVTMRPKLVQQGLVQSGTAGVYSIVVQKPKWLDTNSVSAATEHYGLNGLLEDMLLTAQATAIIDIKFDIEYGVSLRNVK